MPRLPSHVVIETSCHGHSTAAVIGSQGTLCIDTPILPVEAEAWRKRLLEKNGTIVFILQMDSSPDRAFAAGIAERGLDCVRRLHTIEKRVGQILAWVETGKEPSYR